MISGQHSRRLFQQTHWSLAIRPDARVAADASAALVELCRRFWHPVYAYLRRFGHAPETAREMTAAFLQNLFEQFRDGGTAPAQGRFRQYLLARLRDFVAGGAQRPARAGELVCELSVPPPDLESRHQRDNASAQSPEEAYQQSFALELLERALARLREEATQTGHSDMFEALEPFLAADPSSAEADDLATRLGSRAVVVIVALRRMRQRFRELVDAELVDTVASADELLAEQQALFAVLRECV